MNREDIRCDHLSNIRASADILVTSLKRIQNDGDAESFESHIYQLADCLEEIFSRQVIRISKVDVSKYPRLYAVQKIASTSDDWKSNTRDFFDAWTLEDSASWNKLRGNLERLTDELHPYGGNLDMIDRLDYAKAPQEPGKETHDFISRALGAVLCRCHVKSERELMWLLGSCQNETLMPELGCLCILASRDEAFMQWYELLMHEPSMDQRVVKSTTLRQSEETIDLSLQFHSHPSILELGVILLEIQLGKRLQTFFTDNRDLTSPNKLYCSAWKVYRDEELKITSLPCRDAIRACLSPDIFEGQNDVHEARTLLFEKVIRPLEEELLESLPRPDPNNLEGKTTRRPLSGKTSKRGPTYSGSNFQYREINSTPPFQDVKASQAPRGRNTDVKSSEAFSDKRRSEGRDTIQGKRVKWGDEPSERSSNKSKANPLNGKCDKTTNPITMLSDAREHVRDKGAISDWTKWFKNFTSFRRQILPYPVDPKNQQRVRVTVIDTGIDGSHPFIMSKRWVSVDENASEPLFYDFAESDPVREKHDPIDQDGHGTFIAGILLQIAPDIELSVARIGVTRESIQHDAQVGDKIYRAIKHAIHIWETDIISMSFGSEEISYKIRDAINEALKRNIILLAAAGNSGNYASTPYPAKEDGVFKIFAADTSGFAAKFSPPVDDSSSHNSYFILGSGVMSTWPLGLQEQAQADGLDVFCHSPEDEHDHSKHKCDVRAIMSGTSFATPIAAALVAIIYQFYDANESEIKLREDSTGSFKSPQAIRAIFSKMSTRSDQAPYSFLVPDRGRDSYFWFRRQGYTGLNNEGQTPIEFFSKRLSDILYSAEI
ncbi:uncharacterized protein Triagg1_6324 [Trichoderma aggressivum f. europaeum]|uniref:Peptidase S8/S53 domain-containing protein n=1 Tax=Trichoderma aggressivum f. europaeum TaxID=173218 RepID=A0AAE1IAV8_9HYPO|nr:hypothetical protein Triagg1_6324 [Trichoderma aggressivum f. europaeum]